MIPRLLANPFAARIVAKDDRITSMCMAIADFTCSDCIAEWCTHECHQAVTPA